MTEDLAWKKMDGLLPAVVQDADTLQVLMVGYMNPEALEQTRASGRVTFFSRSKQRLWQKGESSGNHLELVDVVVDCDGDALLVRARPVSKTGTSAPTCHRGTTSCFGDETAPGIGFLGALERIIGDRARTSPADSYTSELLSAGIERVAQKVGEEAVELILAAVANRPKLLDEAADLCFHWLVLLRASGTDLAAVANVLRTRHEKKSQ